MRSKGCLLAKIEEHNIIPLERIGNVNSASKFVSNDRSMFMLFLETFCCCEVCLLFLEDSTGLFSD
jgi:hypothetical protein